LNSKIKVPTSELHLSWGWCSLRCALDQEFEQNDDIENSCPKVPHLFWLPEKIHQIDVGMGWWNQKAHECPLDRWLIWWFHTGSHTSQNPDGFCISPVTFQLGLCVGGGFQKYCTIVLPFSKPNRDGWWNIMLVYVVQWSSMVTLNTLTHFNDISMVVISSKIAKLSAFFLAFLASSCGHVPLPSCHKPIQENVSGWTLVFSTKTMFCSSLRTITTNTQSFRSIYLTFG